MQEFYVGSALDFSSQKICRCVKLLRTYGRVELCLLSPVGSCVMLALHYF